VDDALAQTGKMCERWGRWVEGFLYIVGFGVPSDYPGGSVLPPASKSPPLLSGPPNGQVVPHQTATPATGVQEAP
jgi:hypothetical protein